VKQRGFKLEPVHSGDAGSIYTIQFEGELQTEFDKFLENESVRKEKTSFDRILGKLRDMSDEYGFPGDLFKEEEGCRWDYVVALSEDNLRLYCLRIDDVLIIIGNGGEKTTRTYQEDPHLNVAVEDLQMVHKVIMSKITCGLIRYDRRTGTLRGSLNFFTDK
jgi:hypothetical protein